MRGVRHRLVGLVVTLAVGASPAVAPTGPLPSPRVFDLEPRVFDLQKRVVDLKPKKQRDRYTVDSDVLFDFDSASLSNDAASALDDVVADLRKQDSGRVTIVGHTDAIGSTGYNRDLSERRARAVSAYLRREVGNSRLSYGTSGRGESQPVAENTKSDGTDNPPGRRKNRRVEISYA